MKIDKTEREFREELYRKLEQGQYLTHPMMDFRVPYFRAVVDLLDLEFKSERVELTGEGARPVDLEKAVRSLRQALRATHFAGGEQWHGTKYCPVCAALSASYDALHLSEEG